MVRPGHTLRSPAMDRNLTLSQETVDRWIDAHDAAWRANDPTLIGELFSEDGVYHLGPFEGPWRGMDGPFRGREAIVAGWLGGADPSERFEATHEVLAFVERRAVVAREITYFAPDERATERY